MNWLVTQLRFRPPNLRPTRQSAIALVVSAVAIVAATLLAGGLNVYLNIANASIVYLLAIVLIGMLYGGWMAVGASVASFLIYDFFFVEPKYTFSIAAPEEWLDLILFLVIAIAIGRLTALQRARAHEAEFRTAEARAAFAISREVGNAATVPEAAALLADRLVSRAEMARVWLSVGSSPVEERTVADSAPTAPRPSVASRWVLRSPSPEAQPDWMLVRDSMHRKKPSSPSDDVVFRIPVEAGGEVLGSVWATRHKTDPRPGRSHTRLLASGAYQFGQMIRRSRLSEEATAAEVARQSDALKTALLDSVSHDLRTPLQAIRASAAHLMDSSVEPTPGAVRAAAKAMDREAERLSRLIRNLLDMSRIQADALDPTLEIYDLADLVDPVVERVSRSFDLSRLTVDFPDDLPPVRVDAQFIEQIVTNLLENAARYAPDKDKRLTASVADHHMVELVVEDAGPGVPSSVLPRLFDRFYRGMAGGRAAPDGREGMGVGLAVVRGLTEAMGGAVEARHSALGGLAIAIELPAASPSAPRSPLLEEEADAEPGGLDAVEAGDELPIRASETRAE